MSQLERNAEIAAHVNGAGEPVESERENQQDPPILLVYDGHGSHTTAEMIEYALQHNIILFCLIPHTTHRLQPLDVGCFGPLQAHWCNRCNEILEETGEGMDMKDVVREYFTARRKAFTEKNILQAWRKSGLRPLNPDIFTTADFAPSHSSSSRCHAPSTFPSRMPHVPDASSDDGMFDPATFQHIGEDQDLSDSSNESDWVCSMSSDTEEEEGDDGDEAEEDVQVTLTEGTRVHVNQQTEVVEHTFPNQPTSSSSNSHRPFDLPPAAFTTSTPLPPISPPLTRTQLRREQTNIMPDCLSEDASAVVQALRQELARKDKTIAFTRAQRDAAETHAIQAIREASIWKFKFNKKKEKKTSTRRLHTSSRVVTNEQGLLEAQEDRRKREEKERAAAVKQKAREEKKKADIVRRATGKDNLIFAGSLTSKNKTDLEDILDALGFTDDGLKGTKPILISRITEYFNTHPRFKEDPRFEGLFAQRHGRKHAAPVDENNFGPPSQRRRIESPSALTQITNSTSMFMPPPATSSRVMLEDLPSL